MQSHRNSLLSAAPTIVCNDFEYFPLKVCQLKGDDLPPSSCVHAGVSVSMTSLCVCSIVGVSMDILSLGIT